ncbi:50S ribosomal protein L20 [bacterium]|nr:50S ribosomal protein L20 [bacterium]|tara:strand:+ start:543 stop:893 length:351 start_codon:yes stop_codon:yes gene_type:complete
MVRVKTGSTRRARHKKVLKLAKGFRASGSRRFRKAKEVLLNAGTSAYRDRKNNKRNFRRLWISRLTSALQEHGVSYSRFQNMLKKSQVELNRKMLSEIAITEPEAFKSLVSELSKK